MTEGWRQKQFGAYSLHHTYFFVASTLGKMLRKAGYEPVRVRTFNTRQFVWRKRGSIRSDRTATAR